MRSYPATLGVFFLGMALMVVSTPFGPGLGAAGLGLLFIGGGAVIGYSLGYLDSAKDGAKWPLE